MSPKNNSSKNYPNSPRSKTKKYIVFKCGKCGQFTYAKLDQIGKKCPKCRHYHYVKDNIDGLVNNFQGHIVENSTKAMNLVKTLQNQAFKVSGFKQVGFENIKPRSFNSRLDNRLKAKNSQIDNFANVATVANANERKGIRDLDKKIKENRKDLNNKKSLARSISLLKELIKDWQDENSITPKTGFPPYIIDLLLDKLKLNPPEKRFVKYSIQKHLTTLDNNYLYLY
ncbi:MAG: hypothetical protein ACTSU2_05565 [Promethearchaeota archaeon]